jgi:hypothetical protein
LLNYGFAIIAIAGATLIPAFMGLYLIANLKFIQTKYIAALGLGLTIFFFFDTFGDADELDVNGALYPISYFGGWFHISLILVFAFGIAVLAIIDHLAAISPDASSLSQPSGSSNTKNLRLLIFVPIAVAAVMGIHGLGEGWAYGATSSSISGTSLLDAFSPGIALPEAYSPLISYPIHKLFEAAIIGCVYVAFIQRNNLVPKEKWHIPVLGLLFGLTSVIGASIGYFYVSFDVTYFYAFGVTSALYAAIRLAEAMTKAKGLGFAVPAYLGGKVFLALGIGFFLLYIAALLH